MTGPRRFGELDQWLAWLTTLHPKQIDMSLDRVEAVLATLGIARPPYRIITVAGTNGKGSCVALLERIYLEAGHAVGSFTSPHLIRFNERLRVGGQDLEDAEIVDLFAAIDDALGDLTLSYFEASAVAALLGFTRAGVDVAVLEVGMGGRLDAVNAVDADCALIVSIDLDHMDYLGPNRDVIGREKAGIVRDGRPAVVADTDPPGGLLDEIERRGGRLVLIDRDFGADPDADGLVYWSLEDSGQGGGSQSPSRASAARRKHYPRPSFGGRIQVDNAAAVIAVVEQMQHELSVSESALAQGLAKASIPGRFERHDIGGVEWIFDVAHNPASAALFSEALSTLPAVPRTLAVFGAMRDKDLGAVLQRFAPEVDAWFVGAVDSDRGADPAMIAGILESLGAREIRTFFDIEAAARAARAESADRVLVFGSFYTVGPAMTAVAIY